MIKDGDAWWRPSAASHRHDLIPKKINMQPIRPLEPVASIPKSAPHGAADGPCTGIAPPVDAVVQLASFGGFDMRLDLTPYRRSTIGFDRLFDLLETNARTTTAENYPPFNLERLAEDRYRITLAVAGFTRDEIEITAQQNLLLVSGKKDDKAAGVNFLHVGIANRSFERRFELADFVFVEDARLNDGLLVVDLVREVPEAMKPKSIAIKTGAPLAAVENVSDQNETGEAKAA
jgi:molecular chaperone IbpA